jgi:Lar family restriction alleviation protein
MSNTEALKPCPFCGGRPGFTQMGDDHGDDNAYNFVICTDCGATCANIDTRPEADCVEAWNRRAALAAQQVPEPTTDETNPVYRRGWSAGYKHGAWQAKNCAPAAQQAPAAQPVADAVPLFWYRPCRDGLYEGPHHHNSVGGRMLRDEKPGEWVPLYAGAAPGAQQAEPTDPMGWPLPCDVKVGHGTMRKGVPLRTLVARMKVLYEMATGENADRVANRTPAERAELAAEFQRTLAAAHPQQPAPLTEEQIVMDAIMMMPTSIASDCAKACEYGIRYAERYYGIGTATTAPTTDPLSNPQR